MRPWCVSVSSWITEFPSGNHKVSVQSFRKRLEGYWGSIVVIAVISEEVGVSSFSVAWAMKPRFRGIIATRHVNCEIKLHHRWSKVLLLHGASNVESKYSTRKCFVCCRWMKLVYKCPFRIVFVFAHCTGLKCFLCCFFPRNTLQNFFYQ